MTECNNVNYLSVITPATLTPVSPLVGPVETGAFYNDSTRIPFAFIVNDVNLILDRCSFDISAQLHEIGQLFRDAIGYDNWMYTGPGCCNVYTVQYTCVQGGGLFPMFTTSNVGPDPCMARYGFTSLLAYYTAYNDLVCCSPCSGNYLVKVNNFIEAYKCVVRFFSGFDHPITAESLSHIDLYGGLAGIDNSEAFDYYPELEFLLNSIGCGGLLAPSSFELFNVLLADYTKLQDISQDNGLLALSRGLNFTINKDSRIWNPYKQFSCEKTNLYGTTVDIEEY